MHLTKTVAYGATDLLDGKVLLLGLALTPAALAGAWLGKRVTDRVSDRAFVVLVETGLVTAGILILAGI